MTVMVRDLPKEERPREKLIQRGAASLSDTELLAILLRTGTSSVSVLHLAEEVLAKYQDKGLVSRASGLAQRVINGETLTDADVAT